jgi:hypothetical protein
MIGPSLASADGNEPILALAPGAAMLNVDMPAPNAMVNNGQTIDIGGWTTGSRVDVYLDGPAGVGRGVGSASVDGSRTDVARATGSSTLGSSGFDVSWQPTDLTGGAHSLWIYSLVNGSWTVQVVPIMGAGNIVITQMDRDTDHAQQEMTDQAPTADITD